jgi:hypothetical protein
MKKLEKLTDAQLARLPQIRDEWLKIGLSTEPLNFEAAKSAVAKVYAAAGLDAPKLFFRFQSPIAAAIGAAILKAGAQVWAQVGAQVGAQVRDQVRAQVGAQVWAQVGDQVWDQVGDQVGDQVRAQVGAQVYGAHDSGWLSFYAAFLEFGIKAAEKLQPLQELAKHCGWWAPYTNMAILQDRPSVLRFDDQKRLHCEDGPAIRYPDGLVEVFAWHGTRIPREWIEDKSSLNGKIALAVENVEQRRVACEIVGWANVLEQLKAKTIDKNENEEIGELVEVLIPDSGKEKFLRVRCGTGRGFAIPVPPEMKTALQANAWTYGFDNPSDYSLEVRT